jgi:ABC-type bacteriocin/lantibiotic exporter with double-glycine peptidase domain
MLIDTAEHMQSHNWDCGRTVLPIVCDHYGKPVPLFISKLSNAISGLAPDTLSAAFRSLGFKVLEGSWTVPILQAVTKDNKPVVVLTQLNGVGHWSVCRGVQRGKVYLQCPSQGRVSVPIDQFDAEWIDYSSLDRAFDRWAICPYL